MYNKFTLLCTAIGAAICLIHAIGHNSEPVHLLFYSLSVPAWFYPLFTTRMNSALLYFLTILTWAVIGYAIDRFSVRRRSRS